jgi:hypothetical protein
MTDLVGRFPDFRAVHNIDNSESESRSRPTPLRKHPIFRDQHPGVHGLNDEPATLPPERSSGQRSMPELEITCPQTRLRVPTGIAIDVQSIVLAWALKLSIKCPLCGEQHDIIREAHSDTDMQAAARAGADKPWNTQ